MRTALAAMSLTLLLGGCFDDQRREMGKCNVEAVKTYPDERNFMDRDKLIVMCMEAAGYEFDLADDRCKGNYSLQNSISLQQNVYCYVPANKVGRVLFDWEVDAVAHRPVASAIGRQSQ